MRHPSQSHTRLRTIARSHAEKLRVTYRVSVGHSRRGKVQFSVPESWPEGKPGGEGGEENLIKAAPTSSLTLQFKHQHANTHCWCASRHSLYPILLPCGQRDMHTQLKPRMKYYIHTHFPGGLNWRLPPILGTASTWLIHFPLLQIITHGSLKVGLTSVPAPQQQ